MAETLVPMYFPGPDPKVQASFPASVVPGYIALGWLQVDPNAPVPLPPGDPYPQYVTQAEIDGFVAPLLGNPASLTGVAGRAASVSAVEQVAALHPAGLWEFDKMPTFGGLPIGGGSADLPQYDVRRYLNPGETLPSSGSADASVLIARAMTALATVVAMNGGRPVQVKVPSGFWRINTALPTISKVGINGDGAGTVFLPYGNQCFIKSTLYNAEPAGGWEATMLDDIKFSNFAVDCSNQTNASYDGAIKAFFIQNLRRAKFHNLSAVGSWASMYGVDFLVDCEFVNCYGKGAGRGGPADVIGTGSIFAYGTGRFDNESIRFVNCHAENAAAGGWFFERIEFRQALLRVPGYNLIGCRSVRNAVGLIDCGSGGVKVTASEISHNTNVGIYVGNGGVAELGGKDGIVTACTFYKNGGSSTGSVSGGHAIAFRGKLTLGGWTISGNQFLDNLGAAIAVLTDAGIEPGGLRMVGNTLRRNTYGLCVESVLRDRLVGLSVVDNTFDSNTTAGIYLGHHASSPQIVDNVFTGTGQPIAIQFAAGKSILSPVVQGNSFVDQAQPMVGVATYSQTFIRDNPVSQTLDVALAAATGGVPVLKVAKTPPTNAGAAFTPVLPLNQPLTVYVVAETAPASNARAQLRASTNSPQLDIGRNSAGTSWVALARNSAGANLFSEVPAASAPAVLCARRIQAEVALYVRGVGSDVDAIGTYPAEASAVNYSISIGFALVLVYAAEHDATMRTAVMDLLAAQYGIS